MGAPASFFVPAASAQGRQLRFSPQPISSFFYFPIVKAPRISGFDFLFPAGHDTEQDIRDHQNTSYHQQLDNYILGHTRASSFASKGKSKRREHQFLGAEDSVRETQRHKVSW